MKLILGEQFIHTQEDENTEFKEFCLNKYTSSSKFDETLVIDIIKTGKINIELDKLIRKNLNDYLLKYLPRYYSSFCNSKLSSKLYIGINDMGEITGIPILGKLSKKNINTFILNKVFPFIKGDKDIDDISIEIIKLSTKKVSIYNTSDHLLENYKTQRCYQLTQFNEYHNNYVEWHKLLESKSGKLIEILQDNKEKYSLIQYIKNNRGPESIIKYLENNHKFKVPGGKEMARRKVDKNDFIYWLVKYKDIIIDKIIQQKPKKPYIKMNIDPFIILDKLTDMRAKFILQSKVNYYMIVIHINGINKKEPIYYYNNNKLIYHRRVGDKCMRV